MGGVINKAYARISNPRSLTLYHVRVDALTNSTQNLKLIGEDRQSTYTLQHYHPFNFKAIVISENVYAMYYYIYHIQPR
jgi:hypothetical protein